NGNRYGHPTGVRKLSIFRIVSIFVALLIVFPPAANFAQEGDASAEHRIEEAKWEVDENHKQVVERERSELILEPGPSYEAIVTPETSQSSAWWISARAPPIFNADPTAAKKYPN